MVRMFGGYLIEMLIQAYMTASIQVDAEVTEGHSPGYLADKSNVFSCSIYVLVYKLFG